MNTQRLQYILTYWSIAMFLFIMGFVVNKDIGIVAKIATLVLAVILLLAPFQKKG